MKDSFKKFYSNFLNSINGLREALKEHSFVSEIILGLFLVPFLILIENDNFIKLLVIITYFFLLAFELINTSIEKLSDKVNKEYDADIKSIKDISSAAVFIILLILIFLVFFSIFA